jgi:hypothetical protein
MGQNTSSINIHLMFHLLPVMESYTLLVIFLVFPFLSFFYFGRLIGGINLEGENVRGSL